MMYANVLLSFHVCWEIFLAIERVDNYKSHSHKSQKPILFGTGIKLGCVSNRPNQELSIVRDENENGIVIEILPDFRSKLKWYQLLKIRK